MIVIYTLFSSFREDDFFDRLEKKAISTAKLLIEVQEIDQNLLQVIEEKSNYKMYRECVVVTKNNGEIIFSSAPYKDWYDTTVFAELHQQSRIRMKSGKLDIIGLQVGNKKDNYCVFIAGEDKFGIQKLVFLTYLLIVTFLVSTLLIFLSTTKFIKKLLEPLDLFEKEITNISANQLNIQITDSGRNDEISLLTVAFNQMLERIEDSYEGQKAFSANASHELRTPIARIILQLENLRSSEGHSPATLTYLKSILSDANQMSELITSLLLLSKLSKYEVNPDYATERMDEILFESYEHILKSYPELRLNFEIIEGEGSLEINCSRSLINVVFTNLFKNAALYSDDQKVTVVLDLSSSDGLKVHLINTASSVSDMNPIDLFQPFVRGNHTQNQNGSGLGLSIVKRIMDYHNAEINYEIQNNKTHHFSLLFRK